ncbi:hypothetical protein FQ707_13105 [Bacteroidaceae bacterium HV4-6-C5C]|jgi:hypothetical protein|nr:hypothetical protein FQ707_13105 [Bacteroidaceae bacterium HV4-6-C5C]
MEDVLKFLFIAGIILIGIARQVRKDKEAGKKTLTLPTIPNRDKVEEQHAPTANVIKKPAKVASQRYATDSFAGSSYQPTISTLSTPTTTLSNNTTQAAEAESDFSIRSIEEARKAIIWSEILRRKY